MGCVHESCMRLMQSALSTQQHARGASIRGGRAPRLTMHALTQHSAARTRGKLTHSAPSSTHARGASGARCTHSLSTQQHAHGASSRVGRAPRLTMHNARTQHAHGAAWHHGSRCTHSLSTQQHAHGASSRGGTAPRLTMHTRTQHSAARTWGNRPRTGICFCDWCESFSPG